MKPEEPRRRADHGRRFTRRRQRLPVVLLPADGRVGVVPRALVILLGAAAAVITIAGVRAVAWLVAPVFLALVIVVTVNPVQTWLRRKGWPRWLTGIVLTVVVYAVMVALFLVVIISLTQLATLLPSYVARANELVQDVVATLGGMGVGEQQLHELASSLDLGKLVGVAGSLLAGLGGLLTNLLFLLALLLFLCTEATWVEQRFRVIAEDRPWITAALGRFASGTRSYLLVTTIFGFIVAVLDAGALALIGIPAPILWGLLAFVTNYIPNVGFIIGVAPPALLGLLDGGWQTMLAVIAVYILLNFVMQSLIQPRFVATSVGLSTFVTVLALVFWAWLLGPLGPSAPSSPSPPLCCSKRCSSTSTRRHAGPTHCSARRPGARPLRGSGLHRTVRRSGSRVRAPRARR